MSGLIRTEISAFGDAVKAQLLDGDGAILVQIGAYPPSAECDGASCTATVEGQVGTARQAFTGHAVALNDAIWIARGKLRDARAKLETKANPKALGTTKDMNDGR